MECAHLPRRAVGHWLPAVAVDVRTGIGQRAGVAGVRGSRPLQRRRHRAAGQPGGVSLPPAGHMEESFTQAMRHALILAGGPGLRLWPMSREKRPKQLVSLLNGRSLLTAAAGRLDDVVAPATRYVCLAPAGAKRGVMAV